MKIKGVNINSAEQGSHEWRVARLGRVTSTRVCDLMANSRTKGELFGKTALSMIAEIAAERQLLNEVIDDDELFQQWSDLQCRENAAMRYGKENEAKARVAWELQAGIDVYECGMVYHPTVDMLAGSPDGIVVEKGEIVGVLEIKCPATTKTVISYQWYIKDAETLKQQMPQYYWQCQNNMNVTGAKWCDFVVYTTFLKRDLYVVRIERNEEDIKAINERVEAVNKYIEEMEGGVKA